MMAITDCTEKNNKKANYWIGLIIAFLLGSFSLSILSFDSYFMIAYSRNILKNGFQQATEFLSVHNNLDFMYQKWLMCFLTDFIYSHFGNVGLLIAGDVMFGLLLAVLYYALNKINPKSANNNIVIIILTAIALCRYVPFRPHVFAAIFLIFEYLAFRNPDKYFYIKCFFISLLIMWFHSTMWYVVLIFALPFIVDSFFSKKNIKKYFIGTGIMVLASFLQPNGIHQWSYMINCLRATGKKYSYISELLPITHNPRQLIIFSILLIVLAVICIKQRKISRINIFWVLGSIAMAFTAERLTFYSVIILALVIAEEIVGIKYNTKLIKGFTAIIIALALIYGYFCSTMLISSCKKIEDNTGITLCDEFVEKYGKNHKVFCDPDIGSYLEMYGVKVYYDTRAEVYDIAINHKKDITQEFYDLTRSKYKGKSFSTESIKELEEDYGFDYWVINKNTTFKKIIDDAGYVKVLEDENRIIYKKK